MEYIKGYLETVAYGALIIDTGIFGYRIRTTDRTVQFFRDKEGQVKILLRVIRTETSETMYGFITDGDRDYFDLLMEVPGIGPSTSLAVMDAMAIEDLVSAVRNNDEASFKAIKGIGAKTAKQIIVSLEGKAKTMLGSVRSEVAGTVKSTLIALGYKATVAELAVAALPKDIDDVQEAIKIALDSLAKKG